MIRAWLFLLIAISAEVSGTSSMKIAGTGGAIVGYLAMYVLIAISYYFLSLAAKSIPIGIAYAVWEGLGIGMITVVSMFVFGSSLVTQELIGLGMVILGLILVTAGEEHHAHKEKPDVKREFTRDNKAWLGAA